jgi:hypothetical protein
LVFHFERERASQREGGWGRWVCVVCIEKIPLELELEKKATKLTVRAQFYNNNIYIKDKKLTSSIKNEKKKKINRLLLFRSEINMKWQQIINNLINTDRSVTAIFVEEKEGKKKRKKRLTLIRFNSI